MKKPFKPLIAIVLALCLSVGALVPASAAASASALLHPNWNGWKMAWNVAQLVWDFGAQFFFSAGDAEKVRQIVNSTPILKKSDKQPAVLDLGLEDLAYESFEEFWKAMEDGLKAVGMVDWYIAFKETSKKPIYNVVVIVTTIDQRQYQVDTGADYNWDNGLFYGRDYNGILGRGNDYNAQNHSPQKSVGNIKKYAGFNEGYDFAGQLLYNLQTLRFRFDYQGKDWMIQLWKGSYYLISNGMEVGIYSKPKDREFHYDCEYDNPLVMDGKLWRGDKLICEFAPLNTWWLATFRPENALFNVYTPDKMRFEGSITFKDKAMLTAFKKSVDAQKLQNFSYTISGMKFSYNWTEGK
ncbi:MAG: DUF4474 domain-containing protein [Oscillospiraceae bacterium]|nr:DUF4474 domain-containing protein [Oscillospiraceae bacterium]